MCEHKWLVTNCSRVCGMCGVERSVLRLDSWNKYSAPLSRNYDRKHRFSIKVNKLLGIHSGPPYWDAVWKMLEDTGPFHSPASIRTAIRNSRLKTKHYDCLRIFCDAFTTLRTPIETPHRLKNYLESCFHIVHSCWLRAQLEDGFFSYDFLLRYFLEQIESPLLVYLKPRTNKRRLHKYMIKFAFIQFPGVDKMYYRSFGVPRFQNA